MLHTLLFVEVFVEIGNQVIHAYIDLHTAEVL